MSEKQPGSCFCGSVELNLHRRARPRWGFCALHGVRKWSGRPFTPSLVGGQAPFTFTKGADNVGTTTDSTRPQNGCRVRVAGTSCPPSAVQAPDVYARTIPDFSVPSRCSRNYARRFLHQRRAAEAEDFPKEMASPPRSALPA